MPAADNRIRSRAASALRTVCARLEQLGDESAAEATYVSVLEADPSMEALLEPAVRCLIRSGHVLEASTLVDLCRRHGAQSDEAQRLLKTRGTLGSAGGREL